MNLPSQLGFRNGEAVTHLCPNFDRLKSILSQEMFLPSYCKEQVDYAYDNPEGNSISHTYAIPMVSFCDVTIPFIKDKSNYGKYGIGLKMPWAIANKMNPVLYLEKNSHAATGVKRILDFTSASNEASKDNKIGNASTWLIQYVKSSKIKLFLPNEIKVVDCYNEREWRYIPQIKENAMDKYPDIIYPNEYETKLERLGKKPHFDQEYGLRFSMNDIAFITVEQDTDIEEITSLSLEHHSLREKIIIV